MSDSFLKPFGQRWQAAYSCHSQQSHGRLFFQDASATRSEFQRDRDRVLHSSAFRRLKHKTQVFVFHEGDHYRTRLTHTLEVSQIARAIARSLGLDEDLSEALALSHDLGHTPFGHTGEDALFELMVDHGGFDHNAQALRIVTHLEQRYAEFDGLNLTWETLEGLVKHNGPLLGKNVPPDILAFNAVFDLKLGSFASAEAQTAALADDIAYNAHDIDDGLRASLFSIDDLRDVGLLDDILQAIDRAYPALETPRRIHELTRRLITLLVEDVIYETDRRLVALKPSHVDDVREAKEAVVAFSAPFYSHEKAIKRFLFSHMYHHPKVLSIRDQAFSIVTDLFKKFTHSPDLMPLEWRRDLAADDVFRRVCDYIAGMTDLYALKQHQRLFDVTPDLR